jgi:anti-anti-sigma factor
MTDVDLEGKWKVLRLAGDVDMATGPAIRDAIAMLQEQGHRHLCIDLRRVAFLDSIGLAVLVAAHKGAKRIGGQLRITGASAQILRLFELSGLAHILGPMPPTPA